MWSLGVIKAVRLLCSANLSGSMAARAALLVPLAAASAVKIPQKTMAGANAVRLPMLVLGDGVSWGRPSNFTAWIELVGENAGIDTAWDYHSEKGIPGAVADAGARRSDVFITSKIPCSGYDGGVEPMNATMARTYMASNLAQLNTTYVDLLLLHHVCLTEQETANVWRAMEEMLRQGQARAIGVSNFDVDALEALLKTAREPISANQCHFAVGEMDDAVIEFCAQHNISLESYGTLHGGNVTGNHPTVRAVAAKYNVSAAVVMMKFVSAHGISIVTASNSAQYDEEDAAMFDFELTEQDMKELAALQGGKVRTCPDCDYKPCQDCQAALKEAGCKPFGGFGCTDCAKGKAAVMNVCGTEAMVYKACYIN